MTERFTFKGLSLNTKEEKEMDRLSKIMNKNIEDMISKQYKEIEKLFKESLKHIFPPIKGEITKGKLRWRGITLGVRKGFLEYWVMQRGKQISPTLKIIREMDTVNYKFITKYQLLKNEGKQ